MAEEDPQYTSNLMVRLLDSIQGSPIQEWSLTDTGRVTIGRSPENNVTIADPAVSRFHVEILYAGTGWRVRSHGRHGTWINGESITTDVPLEDRLVCRLGADGPSLQFLIPSESETVEELDNAKATLDISALGTLDFFGVDESRKEEAVKEIAEADSFQDLLEKSRSMKRYRREDEDS